MTLELRRRSFGSKFVSRALKTPSTEMCSFYAVLSPATGCCQIRFKPDYFSPISRLSMSESLETLEVMAADGRKMFRTASWCRRRGCFSEVWSINWSISMIAAISMDISPNNTLPEHGSAFSYSPSAFLQVFPVRVVTNFPWFHFSVSFFFKYSRHLESQDRSHDQFDHHLSDLRSLLRAAYYSCR